MVSTRKTSQDFLHLSFSEIDFVAAKKNVSSKSECSFIWTGNWDTIWAEGKAIICKVSYLCPLLCLDIKENN